MYTPSTIANYFVSKYSNFGALTPMKLLKLAYIAQGFYLALSDNKKKLIDEDVQAWDYGPVFPSLYRNLKKFGKTAITQPIPTNDSAVVSENDAKFLETIWDKYGRFDGVILSAMTHTDGTPWKECYIPGQNNTIPTDKIFTHYKGKLKPE